MIKTHLLQQIETAMLERAIDREVIDAMLEVCAYFNEDVQENVARAIADHGSFFIEFFVKTMILKQEAAAKKDQQAWQKIVACEHDFLQMCAA